jgi:hypothetical protein
MKPNPYRCRVKLAKPLSILIAGLGTGFFAGSLAGDRDLSASELPEAVRSAIERAYPGAEFTRAEEIEDDDEQLYRVRLRMGPDQRDIRLEVSPAAEILDIDEEIPESELPQRVQRAVSKAFPRHKVRHAEKEIEFEIVYRVDITSGNHHRELKISRRGRILEIEEKR